MTINPWQQEGTTDEGSALLIFNKWAEQPNRRVLVWHLPSGDITIEIVSTETGAILGRATLASYRAADLAKALGG